MRPGRTVRASLHFPNGEMGRSAGNEHPEDGTLKPAGLVFKDIAFLVAGIQPVGYDPATARVYNDQRHADCADPRRDGRGMKSFMRAAAGCLAAMAQGTIKTGDGTLVEGPAKAYVYLRAEDGGFAHANEVYVKCGAAGHLQIARGGVKSVELVDAAPVGVQGTGQRSVFHDGHLNRRGDVPGDDRLLAEVKIWSERPVNACWR